jgi:hypothetical protein
MRKNLLLFLLIFLSFDFFSQDKGYLEFAGRCIKDNLPLKGATINVYKGSTKVTDLVSPKNGKFQFFLPYGTDYKVTFSNPGCPDMFLMIYTSKFPSDPDLEPIYDIDVNFFEYGKPTINYANFKNPFTKILFDGKKKYMDDEAYATEFLQNLYIDVDAIKRQEEQIALEKHKKELEAKMKLDAEEKLRQQELAEMERKSQEEADRLKKQNDAKKTNNNSEGNEDGSIVSKEVELTIDKEKRNLKEKQNKAIRANYESDLLKIVATNERTTKVAEYVKKKNDATRNEVIETLKKEAETKAKSEQVVFDSKTRNKQVIFNRQVRNQEMVTLIKQSAFNDMRNHYKSVKKFPEVKHYKAPGLIGIITDVEQSNFKTVYNIHLSSGDQKTNYRKEKYSWGLIYYYKNEKSISEEQYMKEISPYNIAL